MPQYNAIESQLPENFAFDVYHECGWGCRGSFVPSRYNSSRAKCIRCSFCQLFFSPNKFIFHSHRLPESRYVQPDAANFNSWRRHMKLCGDPPEEANSSNSVSDMQTAQIVHAWEDVKAMFNGGTRKRLLAASTTPSSSSNHTSRQSSSNSHGGSSGSGSVKASHGHNSHNHGGSGRCQPRGDSQNTNNSNNSGSHSRLGGGSQAKNSKESSSSSVSVTSSSSMASAAAAAAAAAAATASGNLSIQHAPNAVYNNNHDAPHAANFLHQPSQNPFLNVHNPLLSPTGRLDAIWNPALPGPMAAAAAAAAANIAGQQAGSTRQCPIPNSPPFPALPFHPLSIPWLRRPLFPFSHPFGPTLINDAASGGGNTTTPEKLVNLARQNQSAFKPVSRSAEPLFNWLNGNIGVGGGAAGNVNALTLGQCSVVGSITTLPEDLSLNSTSGGGGHAALNVSNNGNSPQITGGNPNFSNTVAHAGEKHPHRYHNSNNNNNNNSVASKHHQIQILSTNHNDSDDEENVDIESTVETEECSSTSSVWVSSTTAVGRSGGGGGGEMMLNNNNNNSVNNNNNNKIHGFARRKRLATTTAISCYSSGDEDVTDERDRDSDNHDDNSSTMDHYEETLRTSGERGNSKSGKRKRLWVNEIISTTDDDEDGNNKQGKR